MKVNCGACGNEQERMPEDQLDDLAAVTCTNCGEPIPVDHAPEEPIPEEKMNTGQKADNALNDVLVIDDNHDFL